MTTETVTFKSSTLETDITAKLEVDFDDIDDSYLESVEHAGVDFYLHLSPSTLLVVEREAIDALHKSLARLAEQASYDSGEDIE